MKSKITRGAGFCGLIDYVFDLGKDASHDKDARLISGNMAGDNPRALVAEFAALRRLRHDIERPVWHSSLRLPPGEKMSDEKWSEIVQDYMTRMGMNPDNHPYIAVMHNDSHLHIVSSRIRFDGNLYYGRNEHLIATRIVQQIEKDYGLTITKGPTYDKDGKIVMLDKAKLNSNELKMAGRTGQAAPRHRLQEIIVQAIKDRPTQSIFENRLTEAGVSFRAGSNGYSYQLEGIAFKGSQLGQAFKWAQLKKFLILPEQEIKNESGDQKLAMEVNHNHLIKRQHVANVARSAAWEAERKRRDRYRANRSMIYSVGRLSVYILPRPLGEAVQIAAELLSMIAKMNDWRQAHAYKRQVDQLTTQLHQVKATRFAAEKAKVEKVNPLVPVSTAPTTAWNQNKPTSQQPALQVYGPEAIAAALFSQANKEETGRQRALYLKIADRVEQLPPDTIIYQREAELSPVQLLNAAATAVKTWQEANPDKTKAHAEAWNLKHPDLAALLAVVAEVSDSGRVKPQELVAVAFITAYPSQIARQYTEHASQINGSDPTKAKILKDAAAALNKVSNAREITLPHPSAQSDEITAELQKRNIGSRKR